MRDVAVPLERGVLTVGEVDRQGGEEVVGRGALHVRLIEPAERAVAAEVLARALAADVQRDADPAALTVPVTDPALAADAVAELSRAGVALAGFSLGQPSLDEVFLALTGRPAEPGDGDGDGDGDGHGAGDAATTTTGPTRTEAAA